MTDLDLLMAGAMVTFTALSGAYVAIRHRANETPVSSYTPEPEPTPEPDPTVIRPQTHPR